MPESLDGKLTDMTKDAWPLFELRVVTPRIELRYVDDELAFELANLATWQLKAYMTRRSCRSRSRGLTLNLTCSRQTL